MPRLVCLLFLFASFLVIINSRPNPEVANHLAENQIPGDLSGLDTEDLELPPLKNQAPKTMINLLSIDAKGNILKEPGSETETEASGDSESEGTLTDSTASSPKKNSGNKRPFPDTEETDDDHTSPENPPKRLKPDKSSSPEITNDNTKSLVAWETVEGKPLLEKTSTTEWSCLVTR